MYNNSFLITDNYGLKYRVAKKVNPIFFYSYCGNNTKYSKKNSGLLVFWYIYEFMNSSITSKLF